MQKNIDFGAFPDDPDADAIRTAFEKAQDNFTELYDFQEKLGVLSINRTKQPGITVNQPTGNVLLSADFYKLRVQTSTLNLGRNSPNSLPIVEIDNANQTLFIDLSDEANIANVTIANLVVTNSANITGNLNVIGGNITADSITTDFADLNDIGNVIIDGGLENQFIQTDGTGNLSYAYPGVAQNVVYVTKSGNDSNGGTSLDDAKLTIKSAVTVANQLQALNPSGTTVIFVKAGDYTEMNPVSLSAGVSIVGDNLRTVTVRPFNRQEDIFWVRNRCYITGMTFRSHIAPSAAIAFPERIFEGGISGNTLTVTSYSSPLEDIRVGMFVTGSGIAPNTIITALGTGTGGTGTYTVNITQSVAPGTAMTGAEFIVTSPYTQNSSSITQRDPINFPGQDAGAGMRVDGNLALGLKSMVLDSYTQFNEGGLGIHIINMGYAQLVSIFTICCTAGVKCESGGTCSIANSNNSFGDYGLWSDGAGPTLYTGTLDSFTRSTLVVSGLTTRPSVNDAVLLTDGVTEQFVLVRDSTALVGGISIITFDETLTITPNTGVSVDFKQISLISASSQTFEYVGTGTNILTSTPRLGGIPIQANEIRETLGGRVNYTSTDQFGDFRIGSGLVINEEAGTISGETFDKSLFAVLTPFILALEG